MAKCPNCNVTLGCTCKMRKASNGASCCEYCVAAYEAKLRGVEPPEKNPVNTVPNAESPSGVKVYYNGPGVQISSSNT